MPIFSNRGRHWTNGDNRLITILFIDGWSKNRLAELFKVNLDQMAGRLSRLGLRRKKYPIRPYDAHDVVACETENPVIEIS